MEVMYELVMILMVLITMYLFSDLVDWNRFNSSENRRKREEYYQSAESFWNDIDGEN